MKKILEEIRSGDFAREWIEENKTGAKHFESQRQRDREHPVEQIGQHLRRLMSWIDEKEV